MLINLKVRKGSSAGKRWWCFRQGIESVGGWQAEIILAKSTHTVKSVSGANTVIRSAAANQWERGVRRAVLSLVDPGGGN